MNIKIRTAATVIPLLLINCIAVVGQWQFWRSHLLHWPSIAALGFALALESISVYTALHAHLAALSDDSSLRLRLASYLAGITIGLLNASHYIVHGQITAAAAGMGILSASSPFLWSIHSKRQSRDALRASGLIEPHALRLGTVRWLFHFRRSLAVYRFAAWSGINNPAVAITAWETAQPEPEPKPEPEPEIQTAPVSQIKPVTRPAITAGPVTLSSKTGAATAALAALGSDASGPEIVTWCNARGVTISPALARQVKSRASKAQRDSERAASNGHVT